MHFSDEGQIFFFDVIQTQTDILNKLNDKVDKYIAKIKANQKEFQNKIIKTIEDLMLSHGKKYVKIELTIFYTQFANQVMFHSRFNNIQSLIRIKKILTDPQTKEESTYTEYLMAEIKRTCKHNDEFTAGLFEQKEGVSVMFKILPDLAIINTKFNTV